MTWRSLAVELAVLSCAAVPAAAQFAPPGWLDGFEKPVPTLSISCTAPTSPAKPAKAAAKPTKPADQATPASQTDAMTYSFEIDTIKRSVTETDTLAPGGIVYSNDPLPEWDPDFQDAQDRSRRFVSVGKDEVSWGLRIIKEEGQALSAYSVYLAVYNVHTHKLTQTHATAGKRATPYALAVPSTYEVTTYPCTEKKS